MDLYDNDFCCMELYDQHFRCMEVNPAVYEKRTSNYFLEFNDFCKTNFLIKRKLNDKEAPNEAFDTFSLFLVRTLIFFKKL